MEEFPSLLQSPGLDGVTVVERLPAILRREGLLPLIAAYAGIVEIPALALSAARVLNRVVVVSTVAPLSMI